MPVVSTVFSSVGVGESLPKSPVGIPTTVESLLKNSPLVCRFPLGSPYGVEW